MLRHASSTRLFAIAAVLGSTTCLAVADTDGYFTTAWGTRAKSMAGLSIAFADDAMAVANNPAAITRLGRRLDISGSIFAPFRDYNVIGNPTGPGSFMPGTVYSRSDNDDYFVIPDVGYVQPLKDGSAFGIAVFANGGMNTSWPASANGGHGTFGGGQAGVDLDQLFVAGSYARKIGSSNSLGLSVLFAYQTFSAEGLQGFNPSSTTLSNNGTDHSTGIGARIGWQGDAGHGLHFGAVYQPKISMSRFNSYSGLFADGGKFDIPENYGAGLSYDQTSKATIGAEFKTIRYSGVPAVGNPMSDMPNGLGAPNGPGFGWRDMTVFKIGGEWEIADRLTWRAGVSYGRQPIPSTEMLFNILAPGVVQWHLSTGFSKTLGSHSEISAAFTYSPNNTVSGPNPNDPTQTVQLQMSEWEIAIGYTYKF